MKIEAELTNEEYTTLLLTLGFTIGVVTQNYNNPEFAKQIVKLTNKLLANCPNFVPYDEDNFDPKGPGFPLQMIIK